MNNHMHIRKRNIPTLNEILTLETVSRLGSITLASKELGVSQPTISYHISNLEKRWNAKFFRQEGRKLHQTEYLRVLLPDINDLANRLRNMGVVAENNNNIDAISIAMPGSLANLVLQPNLTRFKEKFPSTHIRVRASNRFEDMNEQGIDIAIRLVQKPAKASPEISDRLAFPLASERIRAVCSPTYFAEIKKYKELWQKNDPAFFEHVDMIGEEETVYWAQFFTLFCPGAFPKWRASLTFNNADAVLAAAMSGHGLALVRDLYARPELSRGTLIEPFDISLESPRLYRIILSDSGRAKPIAHEFAKWFSLLMSSFPSEPEPSPLGFNQQ